MNDFVKLMSLSSTPKFLPAGAAPNGSEVTEGRLQTPEHETKIMPMLSHFVSHAHAVLNGSAASSITVADNPDNAEDSASYLVMIGRLQRLPRRLQLAIFAAVFLVIAAFDLAIDNDLSLFALYLIPTLYAAWFLGDRWGYLSCLFTAAVWLMDDWGQSALLQHRFVPYWNLAGRLVVLITIVAIVNTLKAALEHEHAAATKSVQREFEIASDVQNRLLPVRSPNYEGLEFAFFYQPAREVGGDYFDFIPFGSERMGLAIGDVSGKGLSSALLMASLQSLVRTNLALREGDAAQFATDVNSAFFEITSSSRYATLFAANVDAGSRTIRYVNAGHNPPLLFRKGSAAKPEVLESGGFPVGLLPTSRYRAERVDLAEGDVLVAFTDGVTEALNPQLEEFGQERIQSIVEASQADSAAVICQRIEQELRQFIAGASQWDDITLVVMKVGPGETK